MTPPRASAAVAIAPTFEHAAGQVESLIPTRFASAMERAATRSLSPLDLLSVAETLVGARQPSLVLQLYKQWIAHNPDHPSRHLICFNYGVALSDAGDLAGARDVFLEAIAANKDFLPPSINLGSVLERMGAADQAILRWYEVVNALASIDGNAIGHKITALKQIGRVLEAARYEEHAEAALRVSSDDSPSARADPALDLAAPGTVQMAGAGALGRRHAPTADGELLSAVAGGLRR